MLSSLMPGIRSKLQRRGPTGYRGLPQGCGLTATMAYRCRPSATPNLIPRIALPEMHRACLLVLTLLHVNGFPLNHVPNSLLNPINVGHLSAFNQFIIRLLSPHTDRRKAKD